jgi:hypothetical protein
MMALPPAIQAAAFSPAAAGVAALAAAEADPSLAAAPSATDYAPAFISAPVPVLVQPSRFRRLVARELWDRNRRLKHLRRIAPDAMLTAGATCLIATMGCDLPTTIARTLIIFGGVKALLYPFAVACQIRDFRAGEPCLSRRVYDWFHRPDDRASS